ncbi:MAG: phospholipase [Ignavibacteriales bacterium]|nr:phospholipase [Ignavibacteriales bacterium]
MKKLLFILFCASTSLSFGQIAGYPDFEIVESIPIETTLDNPDIRNTHDVWLDMINEAKRTLDIEEFYISNQASEPLDDIIKAIMKAAERGVKVRVITDARMYKTYPETIDLLGKQKNISTRVIDFGKLAGGVQHAKYFIVDTEQVFIGSKNFDWRALKHIHELGIRFKNADAAVPCRDLFDLDWQLAEKNDPKLIDSALESIRYRTPFRVIEPNNDTLIFSPTCSPRGLIPDTVLWDEKNIIYLIDGAKSDVFCQVLTYSPVGRDKSFYGVLDNALRRAAVRGVNVKMIVSDWSKEHPTIEHLKSLALIPNVEIKFSEIPEWSGGYIPFARVEHCKYLVIDSAMCWLGTSNWEKSYFYNTRNLGLVVKNSRIAGILRTIFLKSWDGPYTELIKPEVEYKARKHGEK